VKKKSILVIVAILIVVAAAYFFIVRRPVNPTSPLPSGKTEESTGPSSLKDLISKGIAQSCTFKNEMGSGKIYISGNKIRGDFETAVEGKTQKSHMIVDDKTSYSWGDGDLTGIKMTFDTSATSKESAAGGGLINSNVSMDYKCSTWITDSSLFALPGSVKFTSFDVPTATGSTSSQCSYCDSLTGDDKIQCLSALKCK
jgi:hypothetical protein